ncbi:Xaa-Pro dipeptidase [Histomonas meleagridis]|uniref:Xaa-Pro dipeptidase n=1 Tax=Histomonas meleagridis TaxID=135588 RepID=UPI00355A6A4F|nr:Xaa-Pro dipeptidase [Histomonas meleagridis]KAH0803620.1 Xaa-Pro dipeptidase [Histomonas meleagridis]
MSNQENCPVPKPELFQYNRREVIKRIVSAGAEGAVLMFGFPEQGRVLTDYDPYFRQESYFWYMTGVNEPDCALYIDIKTGKSILFYQDVPQEMAIWSGEQPTLEEIRVKYGFDEIYLINSLSDYVSKQNPAFLHTAVESLVVGDFRVTTEYLLDAINEQRQIKSANEIELIKHNAKINSLAYSRVLQTLRPGMYEYEVEGEMQYVYYSQNCRYPPFQLTICSGELCSILHYHKKSRKINDGDLVLIDAGGEYSMYCSDNTRTFPSNGKYSDDQRLIYNSVLEAQKAVIRTAKPGVSWVDIALLSVRVMCENLIKIGLLNGTVDEIMSHHIMSVFYPHGLGHGLGLDVHDVAGWPKGVERPKAPHIEHLRFGRVLEPGMVLTVEPGCYFIPMLFNEALNDPVKAKFINKEMCLRMHKSVGGVRIEDDILITEDGCENLSEGIPKEIEEIEEIMRKAKNN